MPLPGRFALYIARSAASMKYETRPVRDHEEWIQLTQRAEGGVYTMAGFLALDPAVPAM